MRKTSTHCHPVVVSGFTKHNADLHPQLVDENQSRL
jgi:hypothetical protein